MADRIKKFGGVSFRIDRPKGYVKEWPQDGWTKTFTYPVDYGYLPRHTGEDGEGLDFFVGDDPGGHLESFQKLKRDEHGRRLLDETKFLVGVTDAEREAIYRLYGDEVWHRKVYKDMDELTGDLPKFKAAKKARYAEKQAELYDVLMEKDAISFGGAWGRLRGGMQAVGRAFSGHQPVMMPLQNARPHAQWQTARPVNNTGYTPAPATHAPAPAPAPVPSMAAATNPGHRRPPPAPGERRPSWEHPGYRPMQSISAVEPLPHDYHPGQEHVMEWLHGGEMSPDTLAGDAVKMRYELMPQHPGMQASVFHQGGLSDTDRSIMAELGRQYERAQAQGPEHAARLYNAIGQGEAPGYVAARHAIERHYGLPASAKSAAERRAKLATLLRYGFKQADAKFADIDKKIMGEIEVTGPNPADWAFSRMTGPQLTAGAETTSSPGMDR